MPQGFKRLIQLGGMYSLGSVLERGIGFVLIPVYTAYLGTAEFGVIGLMSITVELLTKLSVPPFINGTIRHYYAPEYRERRGMLLFNAWVALVLCSAVVAVIFYALNEPITRRLLERPDLDAIVGMYAALLFLQPLAKFALSLLQIEERAGYLVTVSLLRAITMVGVVVPALAVFQWGIAGLVLAQVIGVGVVVASVAPRLLTVFEPIVRLSLLKEPLAYGVFLIPNAFCLFLIRIVDRYFLQAFCTLSVVGIYTLGWRFSSLLNLFLAQPLKKALQPLTLKREEQPEDLRDFVRVNATRFYMVAIWFYIFLAMYCEEIIRLMAQDSSYYAAWTVVPIIGFTFIQQTLSKFLGWGLVMTKRSGYTSRNAAIALATNIGLNFALIPPFGIYGAAVATLGGMLVWNVLKAYYSAKFYDLYFEWGRLAHITAVGIGLYILSLFVAHSPSTIFNISIEFLFLVLYPLLLYYSGGVTKHEKQKLHRGLQIIRAEGLRGILHRFNSSG